MTKNFIEVGRVAVINSGPLKGKFCVILNVIDHKRVLIDAPRVVGQKDSVINVKRQTYPTKHLRLTRFRLKFKHDENHKVVASLWSKSKITEKVSKTRYVIRQQKQQKKQNLNDFERFKLYRTKQRVNRLLKSKSRSIADRWGKPVETKEERKKNRLARLEERKKKKQAK